MLGWGFVLIFLGGLSFLLPLFGRQFVLVTLLGLSGMGSSIVGIVLIGIGIVLVSTALKRNVMPTSSSTTSRTNAASSDTARPHNSHTEKLAMETRREIAAEDAVTVEWLVSVFEGAFMPTVDRLENILWVKGKRLTLQVILATDRKAINLVFIQPLIPGASFLNASLAANNCNVRFGWGRFYIGQTDDTQQHRLIVDFTLLFERGLIPYHIVESFENLELVALRGIEAEFLSLIP